MKKEVAEAWVKALRSGEYKQTKYDLNNMHGYCCLGVLCAISPAKRSTDPIKKSTYDEEAFTFDGESGILPDTVMAWADIYSSSGYLMDDRSLDRLVSHSNSLTFLNDTADWTFSQIADYIEANWEKF